ncbi:TPA: fimbrial protein, partial [Escherichia coli]|nr:fimbrial protein [Escherichia coli]
LPTAVHTNDDTKGVVVKLSTDPKLTNILQPNTQIPMSVTLGGKTLTTAAQTFTADEMNFGATGMSSISSVKDLVIQAQQQATAAGNYQGVVSIILTQAP